ncbi:hypothetical protein VUR80DRAFT_8609 [Thermomyces stellatus]
MPMRDQTGLRVSCRGGAELESQHSTENGRVGPMGPDILWNVLTGEKLPRRHPSSCLSRFDRRAGTRSDLGWGRIPSCIPGKKGAQRGGARGEGGISSVIKHSL